MTSQLDLFQRVREVFPDLSQEKAEQIWIETNGDPGRFVEVALNVQLLEQSEFRIPIQQQRQQELERQRISQEEQMRQREQAEILAEKQRQEKIKRELEERQAEEQRRRALEEEYRLQEKRKEEEKISQEESHKQKIELLKQLIEFERQKKKHPYGTRTNEHDEKIERLVRAKQELHAREKEKTEYQLIELEKSYGNLARCKQENDEKIQTLYQLVERNRKAFEEVFIASQKPENSPQLQHTESQSSQKNPSNENKNQNHNQNPSRPPEEDRITLIIEETIKQQTEILEREREEQEKIIENLREQRERLEKERNEQDRLLQETEDLRKNQNPDDSISFDLYETGIIKVFSKKEPDQVTQTINHIKQIFFTACPILSNHHFEIINFSQDLELMAILTAKFHNKVPDVAISINSHFIGDVEALKGLSADDIIYKLNVRNTSEFDEEKEIELGVLDKVLNLTESLVSGVSQIALLPVTVPYRALTAIWNGISGGGSNSADQNSAEKAEKCEIVDFEVIHTNWYWRHLKRVFRLSETKILRLHPNYPDHVRAAHDYNSVQSLEIVDAQNLIISYTDSSPSDYIRTKSSQIQKMVNLILKRNTNPEKPIVINKSNLNLSLMIDDDSQHTG